MLDPDLAYLLGALRDGSVYYERASRNYVTVFYQKHKTWLEQSIATRLIRLFGVNCKVDEYKPGHWRARVYSKKLYTIWQTRFGYPIEGLTQLNWNTPKQIMNADLIVKSAYIRGFFDAEGDVSPTTSSSPYIGISQKNRQVLEELKQILEELDISTGGIHTIDSTSNTLRFVVASKEAISKFITIINSEHPEKKNSLNRIRTYTGQQT
jgi:intein-encoded DNA endonuclease-like protein